MNAQQADVIRLSDYAPPHWLVERVDLNVILAPEDTKVVSRLTVHANPSIPNPGPFHLDGDELTLDGITVDGVALAQGDFATDPTGLTILNPPMGRFVLETRVRINPAANTKLMGLYRTGSIYCTQCEAEGFRRITYFPDRPDVMSVYTVRIEARQSEAPILLANGNRIDAGPVPDTDRHFAVWHDPFPKPAYLFATVAGELGMIADTFTTMSGRDVALEIYCEPGNEEDCAYSMDALKRSMRWDEERFGREYDLDVFMIVAVGDFNMGAMENKGLNIFNDKYILASPDTATDADYANIEAIIAHEYFHNWTGNRITCRDWFQLCLKEGLTVFRDQEFTGDMRSHPVKRIQDVRLLRSHQFPEDAGPLAHPVRPQTYKEINNFYTATVYEKGAEIVRMIQRYLGADTFRAGMDLYFERQDGTAATIEEFLRCFSDASGKDMDVFLRWYEQAGTPELEVTRHYDHKANTLTLDFTQSTPATPGQNTKLPVPIPVKLGLVGANGSDIPFSSPDLSDAEADVVVINEPRQQVTLAGVPETAIPSLLRTFSAPIRLTDDLSRAERAFLMQHDSDPFNRWEAAQKLMSESLISATARIRDGQRPEFDSLIAEALIDTATDEAFDPAFRALFLALPGEADIARRIGKDVDTDAIRVAVSALRKKVADQAGDKLCSLVATMSTPGTYSPEASAAGRRALRHAALGFVATASDPKQRMLVSAAWADANNMTSRLAALTLLVHHEFAEGAEALESFANEAQGNHLVLDKWLTVQATAPLPGTVKRLRALQDGPVFSFNNPNRIRAMIGAFATANPSQFNAADGSGYDFVADAVITIDQRNPQVAARLMGAFRSWRSLEKNRQEKAHAAIKRVAHTEKLSRDLSDIVERTLD